MEVDIKAELRKTEIEIMNFVNDRIKKFTFVTGLEIDRILVSTRKLSKSLGPGSFEWLALDTTMYVARIDPLGKLLTEPRLLHDLPLNGSPEIHPAFEFNPEKKEYLETFNKRGVYSRWYDIIGLIVDEDGDVVSGPSDWATGDGNNFIYDAVYNPANDTYMINWEDFRHSEAPYYYWPNDIYGALVDASGNMQVDFPPLRTVACLTRVISGGRPGP